jgi:hypothetical protein
MTLDVRHCVSGRIESTDTALLDAIQTELPDESNVMLGAEYTETRRPLEEGDGEELYARMTFTAESQTVDGTEVTPEQAATQLYQSVASADLATKADGWQLRLYRTPEGAVRQGDVREWYEAHPDKQPTDEDGNAVIPDAWDPAEHTLDEASPDTDADALV